MKIGGQFLNCAGLIAHQKLWGKKELLTRCLRLTSFDGHDPASSSNFSLVLRLSPCNYNTSTSHGESSEIGIFQDTSLAKQPWRHSTGPGQQESQIRAVLSTGRRKAFSLPGSGGSVAYAVLWSMLVSYVYGLSIIS